jgi:hypothetical protein
MRSSDRSLRDIILRFPLWLLGGTTIGLTIGALFGGMI